MSYKITAEMREMMGQGVCTTPACGKWEDSRNSIGQCCECHNRQYRERVERERMGAIANKAAGRAYWSGRGIKTGETVSACLSSIFAPAGEIVYGIAKVGAHGVYVKCNGKKLRADIFDKIQKKAVA